MKWIHGGLAVLTLVWLTGCATSSIRAKADPEADLGAHQTFVLLPLPDRISETDPDLVTRVGQVITNTVTTAFERKGYRPATRQNADLAIHVRGKMVPLVDVTALGYFPYYGRMGWTKGYPYAHGYHLADLRTFEEGTLIVEVYDNRTRKMIWVGWSSSKKTPRPEREALAISNTLETILAAYPAARSGS